MRKIDIKKHLRKARFRVSIPFVSYEVTLDDLLDSKDVDVRIKRLSDIKGDLEDTIGAVEQLQAEALKHKADADALKVTVERLEQDKSTAEAMLKLPEESFSRVLTKANSKGRIRGLVEGIIIGLITGILSSLFVWQITKPVNTENAKPNVPVEASPSASSTAR
jgi:hypothetical protein